MSTVVGSRRRDHRRLVLALGVACGLWVGCDAGPEVPTTVERWIPTADAALFDPGSLRSQVETDRWTDDELPALRHDGGLGVDLDTPTVDGFELTFDPPPTFPILVWSFDDPALGRGRMHGVATGTVPGRFRFVVGDHPQWNGRVVSLALDPGSVDGSARLSDLRAIRWQLDGETLAPAVAQAWKIDLGLEVREGWLAPPGTARQWQPSEESQGVLELALGLEPGVRERILFRVTDGEGGAQLLERRVGPADAGRWLTHRIDLAAWSGGPLVFETAVFETAVEGATSEASTAGATAKTIQVARGFPVWGTPKIVAPKRVASLPPNVILISIDTLRADHLELYGHGRETAPHLSDWARQRAVVFEHAIAPSPWTLPSHVSMFTGRDAIAHGVYFDRPAPSTLRTVAEALSEQGYSTAAVTGGGYLNPGFGLAQGFETFHYFASASGEIESGSEHLFETLDAGLPEPFFLFFHTYEVHSPFYARQPHFEELGGDATDAEAVFDADGLPMAGNPYFQQRKVLVRVDEGVRTPLDAAGIEQLGLRYDSGISRVDELLAPLWQRLSASDLGERTLVVITSDHGEALGEAGLGGHAYLYDFNLRIPLIVGLPGGQQGGRRVEQQVRLIDVAPTILDGVGAPALEGIEGVSLLPLMAGEGAADFPPEAWSYAASSNYGASLRLANRSKIIVNDTALAPGLGRAELYHLQDDPSETNDLLAEGREDIAQLRQRVEAMLIGNAQGLELTWRAPEQVGLRGEVRGASVKAMKVKSWWQGCDDCYSWRRGGLRAEVPAAGLGRVVVLSPAGGDVLELSVEAAGVTWSGPLDLAELEDGGGLVLDGGQWVPATEEHAADLPSLRWRWIGAAGSGEASALPAHDPELARQLEALGYLDG